MLSGRFRVSLNDYPPVKRSYYFVSTYMAYIQKLTISVDDGFDKSIYSIDIHIWMSKKQLAILKYEDVFCLHFLMSCDKRTKREKLLTELFIIIVKWWKINRIALHETESLHFYLMKIAFATNRTLNSESLLNAFPKKKKPYSSQDKGKITEILGKTVPNVNQWKPHDLSEVAFPEWPARCSYIPWHHCKSLTT